MSHRKRTYAAPVWVEIGGLDHRGHYETDSGMVRATYERSRKSPQIGGTPPHVLARRMLHELVRDPSCFSVPLS